MDSILALIIVFWIVSAFSKALNPKKGRSRLKKPDGEAYRRSGGQTVRRPRGA